MLPSPIPNITVPPVPDTSPGPLRLYYEGVKQIIVRCTNPDYAGKTFGVQFTDGMAVINAKMPNRWNHTVTDLAVKFTLDLPGYTVEADEWLPGCGPDAAKAGDPSGEAARDPDESAVGPSPKGPTSEPNAEAPDVGGKPAKGKAKTGGMLKAKVAE